MKAIAIHRDLESVTKTLTVTCFAIVFLLLIIRFVPSLR